MGDVFNAMRRADRAAAAGSDVHFDGGVDANGDAEATDATVTGRGRISRIMQQFRPVRIELMAQRGGRHLQVITITSAVPGEGASATAVHLAQAFAELPNRSALLVEADLRRPTLSKWLDHDTTPGLRQWLSGEVEQLEQIIRPTAHPGLDVLPGGEGQVRCNTDNWPAGRGEQLIGQLRDRYDYIIVDTPPVLREPHATALGALSDQTVLVVRLGKTPDRKVQRAKHLLLDAGCKLAGVVLTGAAGSAKPQAARITCASSPTNANANKNNTSRLGRKRRNFRSPHVVASN